MKGAAGTGYFLQNVGSFGGPNERFRMPVVVPDVLLDGGDQFPDTVKNTPSQALLAEIAKQAFHHVEPGGAGRSVVQVKTRMVP